MEAKSQKSSDKDAETNLGDMYKRLRSIKNIRLVILVLKHGETISGSVVRIVNDYKEFLNIQEPELQQKIFKGIITHCDFDKSPENEDGEQFLDIIKSKGLQYSNKFKEQNAFKQEMKEIWKPETRKM